MRRTARRCGGSPRQVPRAWLGLLLDVMPGRAGEAVRDPYYCDAAGFAETWRDVSEAARALVAELATEVK